VGQTPAGNDEARDRRIPPGLKVLLVEDDVDVRSIMSSFLRALGCDVSMAASAEQALLMQHAHPPFDLLLSDIALGAGMRGTELAAQLQQRHPSVPVLLMSGFSSELLDADRDSPPGWEFLPKPCTRQELASAIGKVLAAAPDARS
jgi:DNA-binding NtrC family response regulator